MPHRSAARLTLALIALAGALAPAAHAAYTIPPDNPFVGTAGARGEIYVYGMRNPYRWSFDRANGDMWIGDVGGSSVTGESEEVDHLAAGGSAGANLGWNCLSGNAIFKQPPCLPANYSGPVYTYPSGGDVVIGGYVVRDPSLPAFAGRYLFGQFSTGVRRLEPGGTATTLAALTGISGFGEDGGAHLYVASLNGPVYRLTQNGSALALSSIGNFTQPLAVAAAPGDTNRLFVVEQSGHVMLRQGGVVSQFLDLTSLITTAGGEQGLLAFAVAPDYATSGRVFAYYTNKSNDLQLDEFRRTGEGPDRSDVATRRPVLTIQHQQAQNHNGGQLLFGPDGMLYLSTGDGGTQGDPEGDAQSLGSLLGKIIRIDVGIPRSTGDTTAPRLRTLVKGRQHVLRNRGAIVYLRCSESCGVVAGGRLRIGTHLYKLRRVNKLVPAGKRVRARVVVGPKARRLLARALKRHRHPTVRVNIRAVDGAGNRSPLTTKDLRIAR